MQKLLFLLLFVYSPFLYSCQSSEPNSHAKKNVKDIKSGYCRSSGTSCWETGIKYYHVTGAYNTGGCSRRYPAELVEFEIVDSCPDGYHVENHYAYNECVPDPECTPEPKPEDLYTIEIVSGSEACRNLQEQGTFTTEDGNVYEHLSCWHNSCATDLEHTDYSLMGELRQNNHSNIVDLNESECNGYYIDTDTAIKGPIAYDNGVCYFTEPMSANCSDMLSNDILTRLQTKCDINNNNFSVNCTDNSDSNSTFIMNCDPKTAGNDIITPDNNNTNDDGAFSSDSNSSSSFDNNSSIPDTNIDGTPNNIPDNNSSSYNNGIGGHVSSDANTNNNKVAKPAGGSGGNSLSDDLKKLGDAVKKNTLSENSNTNALEENTDSENSNTNALEENTDSENSNTNALEENTDSENNNTNALKENTDSENNNTNALKENTDSENSNTNALEENTDSLNNLNDTFNDLLDDLSSSSDISWATSGFEDVKNKYSNINLGFETNNCPAISTVSFTLSNGGTYILFSQDTINMLPMNIIRKIIIFSFIMSALFLVFRN